MRVPGDKFTRWCALKNIVRPRLRAYQIEKCKILRDRLDKIAHNDENYEVSEAAQYAWEFSTERLNSVNLRIMWARRRAEDYYDKSRLNLSFFNRNYWRRTFSEGLKFQS
jgi:hypothetical protein